MRKALAEEGYVFVDEKTAAVDACEMEHAVSGESYEALRQLPCYGCSCQMLFQKQILTGKIGVGK